MSDPDGSEVLIQTKSLHWSDIEQCCGTIARTIKDEERDVDAIIGLSRGGLVPATILAHLLSIREGVTMDGLTKRLYKKFHKGAVNFMTATLYCKSSSKFQPDFVGKHCGDEWLVFPWEECKYCYR